MPFRNLPKILETSRLRLRPFRLEDFEDYAAMAGDPEVMRFLGTGTPITRFQAWQEFSAIAGHRALKGYGPWAIEERADGALVGRTGFQRPDGWPDVELIWILGRRFWGCGYAAEAAGACLDAAAALKVRRVVSLIHPENEPSMKVACRLGGMREGEIEVVGRTRELFSFRPDVRSELR